MKIIKERNKEGIMSELKEVNYYNPMIFNICSEKEKERIRKEIQCLKWAGDTKGYDFEDYIIIAKKYYLLEEWSNCIEYCKNALMVAKKRINKTMTKRLIENVELIMHGEAIPAMAFRGIEEKARSLGFKE
jgi:hypothetical protein